MVSRPCSLDEHGLVVSRTIVADEPWVVKASKWASRHCPYGATGRDEPYLGFVGDEHSAMRCDTRGLVGRTAAHQVGDDLVLPDDLRSDAP